MKCNCKDESVLMLNQYRNLVHMIEHNAIWVPQMQEIIKAYSHGDVLLQHQVQAWLSEDDEMMKLLCGEAVKVGREGAAEILNLFCKMTPAQRLYLRGEVFIEDDKNEWNVMGIVGGCVQRVGNNLTKEQAIYMMSITDALYIQNTSTNEAIGREAVEP